MTRPATIDLARKLRDAGLRPTRQRLALARLLFSPGDRHVTAEELHMEAQKADLAVSLATVYNTLNQFTGAGLLREVACEGNKTYFDTNTSNHYHFYMAGDGGLVDIPADAIKVEGLPDTPDGKKIARIDVIVQLVGAN
ncbi:MAG TPA: transcriptional repressor [Rhizobiales bacterium]|nr:transcriptional repressor [Hyphomicrobiales bacterium]